MFPIDIIVTPLVVYIIGAAFGLVVGLACGIIIGARYYEK